MKLNDLMNYYEPDPMPLENQAQQRILASARVPETKKPKGRLMRVGLIAAVLVVGLSMTVAAIVGYSKSTRQLEENWNDAGVIDSQWNLEEGTILSEAQLDYMEGRTVQLQQSVTDAGIKATLDSMTCMSHGVYIAAQYEMMPDCVLDYVPEDVDIRPEDINFYWSNSDYGQVMGQQAMIGPREMDLEGWDSVPNDANLCDGKTVLEIEIRSLAVLNKNGANEELAQIPGAWNFTIEIPALDVEPEYTVNAAPLEDAFGVTGAEFQITSTGCRLNMPDAFHLTIRDNLGKQDDEETTGLVMDFYLKDGTKIPNFGAGGFVENGRMETVIGWTPLDPTTLDHVVITDGETEVTLPIIE